MHRREPANAGALFWMCALVFFLLSIPATTHAQQPFYTDDADVTDKKKLHFQLSNEYDILQRAAYPSLRQNTTVFELDYGLLNGVEIGVDGPLIAISNSRVTTPKTPFGLGDLDFHIKYNFLKEREGSRLPALSATFNVELPTGNAREQIGSGLTDYFLNGILQKSVSKKTKLRLNGGILFAGNTTTINGRGDQQSQIDSGPTANSNRRQLCRDEKDDVRLWNPGREVCRQPARRCAAWHLGGFLGDTVYDVKRLWEECMARKQRNRLGEFLAQLALKATKATGTSRAFILAVAVVIIWLITGPFFHFSDTWQLVINTGTTIITFLMVFLIQRTQNKDALAIHIKLNEIVAALEGASNRIIDVEDLTEEEIETLHKHYRKLVEMAKKDLKLTESHSVEEAEARHNIKHSKHRHQSKS